MELAPGVEYVRTADVKDQIELSGNDIQAVSMTGEWRYLFAEIGGGGDMGIGCWVYLFPCVYSDGWWFMGEKSRRSRVRKCCEFA